MIVVLIVVESNPNQLARVDKDGTANLFQRLGAYHVDDGHAIVPGLGAESYEYTLLDALGEKNEAQMKAQRAGYGAKKAGAKDSPKLPRIAEVRDPIRVRPQGDKYWHEGNLVMVIRKEEESDRQRQRDKAAGISDVFDQR